MNSAWDADSGAATTAWEGGRSEESRMGLWPVRPFPREKGVGWGDEAEDTWEMGREE